MFQIHGGCLGDGWGMVGGWFMTGWAMVGVWLEDGEEIGLGKVVELLGD